MDGEGKGIMAGESKLMKALAVAGSSASSFYRGGKESSSLCIGTTAHHPSMWELVKAL